MRTFSCYNILKCSALHLSLSLQPQIEERECYYNNHILGRQEELIGLGDIQRNPEKQKNQGAPHFLAVTIESRSKNV